MARFCLGPGSEGNHVPGPEGVEIPLRACDQVQGPLTVVGA